MEDETIMADDIVKIIKYDHHGTDVYVREDLKGTHADMCLCYLCEDFKPGDDDNCMVANEVYKNCVEFGLVTPVYECPVFKLSKALEDRFEVVE
jgi:hypothetical protein